MTLIEIDLEGGLVQEVRASERYARVLVHDAAAAEVGEDPRTNLVAVYDPLLVQGAEDPDAFIDVAKEAASEAFADQPRGEPNDDPDIPF